MNVLEIQQHTGVIYLYKGDRYVALHKKDWVAVGCPAKAEDGVYAGRVFITLDDTECKHVLWDWFANGPIDMQDPEHANRLPDGVMERVNIQLQKAAA